jgi:hypothetical protein
MTIAVNLSPIYNAAQEFDNQGLPLAGGLLYTYVAGTVNTTQITYKDSAGTVANSNPIVLDNSGRISSEIWLLASLGYKFLLTDLNNVAIESQDNIFGIGSTSGSGGLTSEWVPFVATPAFVNTNTFTLSGNQTAALPVGRRVQATITAGLVYGTIATSVFTSVTTITLTMDGAQVLDTGLSAVSYGILNSNSTSFPVLNSNVRVVGSVTASGIVSGSNILGVGQTRVLLGAARVLDVPYTNLTGRPIYVSVWVTLNVGAGVTLVASGMIVSNFSNVGSFPLYVSVSSLILPGEVYTASAGGAGFLDNWTEIR